VDEVSKPFDDMHELLDGAIAEERRDRQVELSMLADFEAMIGEHPDVNEELVVEVAPELKKRWDIIPTVAQLAICIQVLHYQRESRE
jgi:hypothetical protein